MLDRWLSAMRKRRDERVLRNRPIPDALWELTLARYPFLAGRGAVFGVQALKRSGVDGTAALIVGAIAIGVGIAVATWRVAIVRWRYDQQGNTLEESYLGVDRRPTGDRLRGVASVRWGYGANGKAVEESYFGTDGQRTDDKNRGVAIVRWQYDADMNTVEERYLGADQRSKEDRRLGVATIRWQYDRYGREIGTTMYDQYGARIPSSRN